MYKNCDRLAIADGLRERTKRMADMKSDAAVLLEAVAFSAAAHRTQRRKGADASPYINHPVEVANILANVACVKDVSTLVAAVLHDTVEDAGTRPDEIELLFGPRVRRLVEEVTDDKALPKAERKRLQVERAPLLSDPARLIKVADKICNVLDVTHDPPKGWSLDRRREYFDWAERVVAGCRGTNEALDRRFDEAVHEGRKVVSGGT